MEQLKWTPLRSRKAALFPRYFLTFTLIKNRASLVLSPSGKSILTKIESTYFNFIVKNDLAKFHTIFKADMQLIVAICPRVGWSRSRLYRVVPVVNDLIAFSTFVPSPHRGRKY